MYASVAAATGWTWEYIGQCLTLPRLRALDEHWRKYPPVHITLALFAGVTTKAKASMPQDDAANDAAVASYIQRMPIEVRKLPV